MLLKAVWDQFFVSADRFSFINISGIPICGYKVFKKFNDAQ
jgi:hypothetical protein